MRSQTNLIFLILITTITGTVILLGYFVDIPILTTFRSVLLKWAIILAAVALLIGLFNLVWVHFNKVMRRQAGSIYSILLLLAFITTLIAGVLVGPTSNAMLWIFNYIQFPVETSLLAVTAVILIVAVIRMIFRRPNSNSMVFIFTAVIVIAGSVSSPWLEATLLPEARRWLLDVVVSGAGRGILIGIAIGTIATGLRVLAGSDRPYES